jgi:hypothetical protein
MEFAYTAEKPTAIVSCEVPRKQKKVGPAVQESQP